MTETTTRPTLQAEFTIESKTEVRIDLVAFFTDFKPIDQAAYWAVDLEGGKDWERPRCYLYEYLSETVEGILVSQCRGVKEVGFEDLEVEEIGRAARAEYDALLAAVSWMDPENNPSSEDVARTPGPLDRPLF